MSQYVRPANVNLSNINRCSSYKVYHRKAFCLRLCELLEVGNVKLTFPHQCFIDFIKGFKIQEREPIFQLILYCRILTKVISLAFFMPKPTFGNMSSNARGLCVRSVSRSISLRTFGGISQRWMSLSIKCRSFFASLTFLHFTNSFAASTRPFKI